MAIFMENTWLNELREHLKHTDEATLKAEWAEIEAMGFEGPNAFEYIEHWTDDVVEELNKRTQDLESGKAKGRSWEEVKAGLK